MSTQSSPLYKYQPINPDQEPSSQTSIKNLLKGVCAFSKRNNFNDLFDSQVEIITPSDEEKYQLIASLTAVERYLFEMFNADRLLEKDQCDKLKDLINREFDDYLFYCLTTQCDSILMWSHYASNHHGFCIEWNGIEADEVYYEEKLAKFEILDFMKSLVGKISKEECGNRIWKALRTKLIEWRYEKEFRYKLSNNDKREINSNHDKFSLVRFDPERITSIIFGVKTSHKVKKYITERMTNDPLYQHIKFKQAHKGADKIIVTDI